MSASTRASITRGRATASTAIRRRTTPSRTRTIRKERAPGRLWRGQRLASGRALHQPFGVQHSDSDRKEFDPTLTPARTSSPKAARRGSNIRACSRSDAANEIMFGAESETRTAFHPKHLRSRADQRQRPHQRLLWAVADTAVGRADADRRDALRRRQGIRRPHIREARRRLAGADGTTLRANYGDGFKAPSLYELFSPYSNPIEALKPETAKGWEAGVDQALGTDGCALRSPISSGAPPTRSISSPAMAWRRRPALCARRKAAITSTSTVRGRRGVEADDFRAS